MARLYDSAKVREAARAVRTMRNNLEDGAMAPGRRAFYESEPLKGEAAEAMRERLQRLQGDVRRICDELNGINAELNRYASALEEVGGRLTQGML